MWKTKSSLRTSYRYAYDVDLINANTLRSNRYLWQRWQEVKWQAEAWCEEHCTRGWSMNFVTFSFDSKDDAMMFKLTWAGQIH